MTEGKDGEMALWLRAHAAPPEVPSLFQHHTGCLTATCHSISRGSDTLFGLFRCLHTNDRHVHISINQNNKLKKTKERVRGTQSPKRAY